VRLLQHRYSEALEILIQARDLFESLGEPGSVALLWHQIGKVHRETGQFDVAEQACRQALAIRVQQQDRAGQVDSLGELGILYAQRECWEEAATFFGQAIPIAISLQDFATEGRMRHNLANVLVKVQRHDDARVELQRAIECGKSFGHVIQPWKTWNTLHDLELSVGNPKAAVQAQQQAVYNYLVYRRDGGESQLLGAELCELSERAINQGETIEVEQALAQYAGTDASPQRKVLLAKLHAILNGDRDSTLANDPELYYADAVELQLLLERLN